MTFKLYFTKTMLLSFVEKTSLVDDISTFFKRKNMALERTFSKKLILLFKKKRERENIFHPVILQKILKPIEKMILKE